ncbi:MAG: T9SS type A sorting domain-containing protein, partial [Bacteroidota bacterium]
TGNLSGDIGLLTELIDLNLSTNDFTGLIPGGIGLLTELQRLRLNRNDFNGAIPAGISNLTELNLLWLHNNNLSGSVPTAIGNLSSLRDFLVNDNELEGSLPKFISQALNRYIAGGNNFSGSIPEDLYVATQISTVSLASNQLDGPLPQLFGTNSPGELRLDNNQLSGCYPASYTVFCGNTFATFANNAGLPAGGDRDFFDTEFCGNNDACGSLPVSWLSFTAEVLPKTVLLRWATAAEEDNEIFTVERSRNGQIWQSLASQPASNTPLGNDYTFTDIQPIAGTAYYRIRQTDFDGTFSFSEMQQVNFQFGFPAAFPNPFSQQLTITSPKAELIQIFDQQGKLVREIMHAGGGAQVHRLFLKSGVYVLRYLNSEKTEKIVAR